MLRLSTLPSANRLGLLPCNRPSINTEKPNCFRLSSVSRRVCLRPSCRPAGSVDAATDDMRSREGVVDVVVEEKEQLTVGTGSPSISQQLGMCRMSIGDQAFLLLAFIACTTSIAFTSFVVAAVPTLIALKRAAMSLSKLADTAREELPSTMAAVRLSGMEISELTLELNDLRQEIADGVHKSAQAVQAAEAGIRRIGSLAHKKTISMIQERANLPSISLRPLVAGAARKTSDAVGQATKKLRNLLSPAEQDGGENISGESG